jgi:hypothetical protein
MKNLDRNLGPRPLRVWGLILNFFGNALAIFGLVGLIRDGSRLPIFLIGSFLTLICILVLAKPSPD